MARSADIESYLADAQRWDQDLVAKAETSRRRAYWVASAFGGLAALSLIAFDVMLPLKSVEPFVIRVDNTTGVTDVVPVYVGKGEVSEPLSFDRDSALEQAMLTFWRYGYETSSIVDLTTAMEITAPSLYAAFGDKKRLFLEAVDRYAGDPKAMAARIDGAATAYHAARDMLTAAAAAFTGKSTPKGCLLASATASGSADATDVQRAVAAIRGAIVARLQARIERDISTGLLPTTTDAASLAGLVVAVIQGMSVLARDGAPRARLIGIGKAALRAWPR